MAWVKFTFNFGPGRQSREDRYVYFQKATKKEINFWLEEATPPDGANGFDGPIITKHEVLKGLPESEHYDKVRSLKGQLKYAECMLFILDKTKRIPEYRVACNVCDGSPLGSREKAEEKIGMNCWRQQHRACGGTYQRERIPDPAEKKNAAS